MSSTKWLYRRKSWVFGKFARTDISRIRFCIIIRLGREDNHNLKLPNRLSI
jgi:hypothetical protein